MVDDSEQKRQEYVIRLFESRLFKGLTPEEVKMVYYHGSLVEFNESESVVREGHTNTSLYVIMQGELMVYLPRTHSRFNRVKLGTLGPGDCIGEYSFIDSNPTSATVSPTRPTILFKISREKFEHLLESQHNIGQKIYKNLLLMLIKRLRESNQQLDLFTV